MINREFYFKSVSQTIRDTIHVYINILVIVGMFLCLYFLIGSEKIPDIYGANAQYIDLSIEVLFEALSLWHTLAYIGMTMHWLNFSSAYALLLVSLFVSFCTNIRAAYLHSVLCRLTIPIFELSLACKYSPRKAIHLARECTHNRLLHFFLEVFTIRQV